MYAAQTCVSYVSPVVKLAEREVNVLYIASFNKCSVTTVYVCDREAIANYVVLPH